MSKKLVQDVALIAARLHEAGLTFKDAELAAQYCLVQSLTSEPGYLDRLLRPTIAPLSPLIQGFSWSETPEGHAYWANRYWGPL